MHFERAALAVTDFAMLKSAGSHEELDKSY
jgi:hypothetical protein